ncbi:MAG: amidohydrolase family protein [Oscillospiraceae bacterium]|nr:amidohydrolase family protein [Oscillospiraceae bacterium]
MNINIIDANCLVGHWPFRKLYKNTFEKLLTTHKKNDIGYGFVSSIESIFYNDPAEGDADLLELIKDTPYRMIATINPLLPYERDPKYSGVKLFPTFHKYKLSEQNLNFNVPVFISARMNHEREDYYIFTPPTIDVEDVAKFIFLHPETTFVLLTFTEQELNTPSLKNVITGRDNVYFDISWLRYTFVENLVATFGAERMVYGSLHPMLCLESTLTTLLKADISAEQLNSILYKNALKIIK